MKGWVCDVRLYQDKSGIVNVHVPQCMGAEISKHDLADLLRRAADGLDNYQTIMLGPKAEAGLKDDSTN